MIANLKSEEKAFLNIGALARINIRFFPAKQLYVNEYDKTELVQK